MAGVVGTVKTLRFTGRLGRAAFTHRNTKFQANPSIIGGSIPQDVFLQITKNNPSLEVISCRVVWEPPRLFPSASTTEAGILSRMPAVNPRIKDAIVMATNLKQQESEPSKPSPKDVDGKPTPEQVLHVYNVLRDNLPKLFTQPMNYKIYSENLLFVNNLLNRTTIGIVKYIQQTAILRTVGHIRFAYVKFDVLNMSHDADEGRVTVRWRIVGLSGFRVMLKFWKFKLWKWQEIMKQQETWYDGISYFDIGADGRIYRHIADKVMVDKDKEVADVKTIKGPLAAKLAVLATLIPRANNPGDGLGFQCSCEEPTSSTLSDLLLTSLL